MFVYLALSEIVYKISILAEYDHVIRHTLKVVLNVDLTNTEWKKQEVLPVSCCGLGIRLVSCLAPTDILLSA